MKSLFSIIFISLISSIPLVICNCNIENHGHQSPKAMRGVYFSVKGIPCQSCANEVRRKLLAAKGVLSAEVFLNKGEKNNVKITFDQAVISVEEMKQIIADTGRNVDGSQNF